MKSKYKSPIALISFVLIVLFGYLFYKEGSLPVNKTSNTNKIFIVRPGESLITITNNLEKEDFIRNRLVFFLIIKQLGIEKKIQAGDFRLSQAMSAQEIAQNLTHGTLDTWLTIIEGLRKEEIAALITKELGIPEVEFTEKTREGYLFPDTYLIPKDASTEAIISILTTNFERRFKQAKQEVRKTNELTDQQVLVLASIVEREAKFENDRKEVASILLRRMEEGHKLQADATVQYALGYQADQRTWWKKSLSFDDLEIDSTYNTYARFGLPPAPICNPGLSSLKAALGADANTPYLFYVSDKKGKLHFARNSDEHQTNINKYLK